MCEIINVWYTGGNGWPGLSGPLQCLMGGIYDINIRGIIPEENEKRAGVLSVQHGYLLINMCIRDWNHKRGLWPLQWSVWVKINEQLKSSQTITSPQTQWQYFHMTHSSVKERSGQKQCASRSSQGVNHKVKNWKQTKWQCSSSNTYAWYTSSRMKTNTERIGSLCSIGALMRGK